MKITCPNPKCVLALNLGPRSRRIVRNGSFFRASDSQWIQKFHCRMCSCYFSAATFSPRYLQKARRINVPLFNMLNSGVSLRRSAMILGVNRKTVVRRFRFLGEQARSQHLKWLENFKKHPLAEVQFDDLETSEHTKCKPLSVSLAVEPIHRKILYFEVSQMPCKGKLARIALIKYGKRKDKRPAGWDRLMVALKPILQPRATLTSDDNPHYPKFVKGHHPTAKHITVKGGRGCISGQGELKKLRFDPLFSLNHTCAMLRANLNRLFRRTWCLIIPHISRRSMIEIGCSWNNFHPTSI